MTNPDQTTDKYAELRTDVLVYLDRCADHFDGTPRLVKRLLAALAETQAELGRSREALNEMQGVVERLPRTKDGVRVATLDSIFFVHPDVDHIMECKEYAVDMFLNVAFVQFQKAQYRTDVYGYSSKEAALAARKGE